MSWMLVLACTVCTGLYFNLDIFLPAFQLIHSKHSMTFSSQISYETCVIKNENNFLGHHGAICGVNKICGVNLKSIFTTSYWCSKPIKMEFLLMYQTNPVGVALFLWFLFVHINLHGCWPHECKCFIIYLPQYG